MENEPSLFKFVGLMLSRKCNANCIFCPITGNRDLSKMQQFMPMDIFTKILQELKELNYNGKINFGENGDALLNPRFRDMYKSTREELPESKMILFTNMMNMGKRLSEFVLSHGLYKLNLNIDGSEALTYEASKRNLKYDIVKKNLHTFIALRNEMKSNCKIQIFIIPPRRFMELRCNTVNKKIPYDAPRVIKYWSKYLSPNDTIKEIVHFYNWTNYPSNKIRTSSCPMQHQLFNNLYISTEGNAYLCCLDYKTEMTYGNIMNSTIKELWNSKKRQLLVSLITSKRFKEAGLPCSLCTEKDDKLRSSLNYLKHNLLYRLKLFHRCS